MKFASTVKAVRLGTLLLKQLYTKRVLAAFRSCKTQLARVPTLAQCKSDSKIPAPKGVARFKLRSVSSKDILVSKTSLGDCASRIESMPAVHSPTSLYAQLKSHLTEKAGRSLEVTTRKPRVLRPFARKHVLPQEQVAVVSGVLSFTKKEPGSLAELLAAKLQQPPKEARCLRFSEKALVTT